MKTEQFSDQAITLADSILKAAGSGLKNYTMEKTRNAILEAAQLQIDLAGGEDNLYPGERHWVRSAAFDYEEISDAALMAREVKNGADLLRRDAVSAGKRVGFYHVKVTAYIREGK